VVFDIRNSLMVGVHLQYMSSPYANDCKVMEFA